MIEKSTLDFLKKLKANNNREWFHANKLQYENARKNILDITLYLISGIEKFDKSVIGLEPDECLFRIYRDTRFSKIKIPYKTNFGSFIKQGGRKTPGAGYYLHISPGENFIGGGIYMPPANILFNIRSNIAKNPKTIRKIISNADFIREFGSLDGEKLKTAPKGFPKDHPEIELLKFKHYMVGKSISDKEILSRDLPIQCLKTFKAMYALNNYVNSLI